MGMLGWMNWAEPGGPPCFQQQEDPTALGSLLG